MTAIRDAIASGNFQEAEKACRLELTTNPRNAEALTLAGIVALKMRQGELAERFLRSAIELDPGAVEARVWLSKYLRDLTRHSEAKVLALKAVELDPDSPLALTALGYCLLEDWSTVEALALFERALAADPNDAAAHEGRGVSLAHLGRAKDAVAALERAVECDPERPSAEASLAHCLVLTGDSSAAQKRMDQAIARFRGSALNLIELGQVSWARGEAAFAELALTAAIEADPSLELPRRMLGRILQDNGQFDASNRVLREALTALPGNASLYGEFAASRKITESDRSMIEQMTLLVRNPRLAPTDRRRLHFALGKSYDDLGEYGRAMQHFDEANGIGHMQLWPRAFNREKLTSEVDAAIKAFTPKLFGEYLDAGDPSDKPILIVGMIRSGTTLVEQIVSSHPAVGAGGELTFLGDHASGVMEGATPNREKLQGLITGYLNRLAAAAPGMERVTDKMPQNFALAGLVHLAFPNARIIHCRRNPMDTCLSIYVTPSVAEYAHAFPDMAFFYREYERLMAHWHSVIPEDRLFDLDYEALIADREPVVRRLMEFLDLPWDDSLMKHEANARAIETPSKWQARQPVYNTSVERWRRYEPWIGDLIREFPDYAGGGAKG